MPELQTSPLALQLSETKVSEADATALSNIFLPFSEQAEAIKAEVYNLTVTSADQVADIRKAREFRLKLKNIRVESEKAKKREKEESLRKGQAIDAVFRYILSVVVPMEEHLEKQENFVRLLEEKAREARRVEREQALIALDVDTTFYNLADMPEESFAKLVESSKAAFELKSQAAAKAEQERIEREQAEAAERQRMIEENERLKKEAAEKEAALEMERQKAAKEKAESEAAQRKLEEEHRAVLEIERKERERIEAEARSQQAERERIERERVEAEARAAREYDAAVRKAQLAPDKEKLVTLAQQIASIPMPSVASAEAKVVIEKVIELLSKTSQYIQTQSVTL
jgi:hypothetical protein